MHWSDPADKIVKRGSRGQKQNMVSCTLDYHDEMFFGLAKVDAELIGIKGKQYCSPIDQTREDNAQYNMGLKKKFMLANWGIAEAGEDVAVADGMEEDKTEEYSYFNMLKNSCYVSIVAWFVAEIGVRCQMSRGR